MITKKEIEKLIIHRKESNLKNHFQTAFTSNSTTYIGDVKNNTILLWKSSSFMRSTYPIFSLNFDDNGKLKNISTQQNPYHRCLNLFLVGVFISIIISQFVFFDLKPAIIQVILIAIMAMLFYFLLRKIYRFEKGNLTEELNMNIKKIKKSKDVNSENSRENSLKKEWSLSKTLTRLIAYPFCLFIIYVSVVEFIPTGKLKLGIFGVLIPLVYIISDIKILFSKK